MSAAVTVTESGRRPLQESGGRYRRPLHEAGGGRDGGRYINNALRQGPQQELVESPRYSAIFV